MVAPETVISIVLPVRNEAHFIGATIERLLMQDYPVDCFEIIVVDGMSDDGTRDIVASFVASDPRVRLLDNPRKLSSAGRNVGFKMGRGDVFVVIDGHCYIPDRSFLFDVAECFVKSGADCLGRPQPLDPPGLTLFQQSVALARASSFGHGGNSLIYGDYEGFASPVSNGAAYRREVFAHIGYVDECFDACEDVEFNYRVEQAGLKAYTSPKLTVRYYPRDDFSSLCKQMRRYGRGRTRLYLKHPKALSITALVPACFAGGVAAFAALLCMGLLFGLSPFLAFLFWSLSAALMAYASLVGWSVVRICRTEGWGHATRLPFIFLAVHGGLGLGMWEELLGRAFGAFARRRRGEGPIRVAFLIDTIESPTAGTERQLLLLLEGLNREKFEPCLCVLQNSDWLINEFRMCPVYVLGISSFKRPVAWWRMLSFARWLRRGKIDILQAHFRDASLAGLPAAWLARVPGIVAMRKNQGYWMTGKGLHLQKVLNLIPDVFVANSEATKEWATRVEGIRAERLQVIYNGFGGNPASGHHRNARTRARAILGIPEDAPTAGIVANLRSVKRIDIFLEAAALVVRQVGAVRFVIVGEGEKRAELEALSAELGLEGRVLFAGKRSDVPNLLPGFDVGVLSSDSESFSNAVVEYMAAGLPVAATDVGGCREALGGSPAGLLVPAGDEKALAQAIVRLLTDATAIEFAMDAHPLRVNELFSKRSYVQAYAELYASLLCLQEQVV